MVRELGACSVTGTNETKGETSHKPSKVQVTAQGTAASQPPPENARTPVCQCVFFLSWLEGGLFTAGK